MDAAQIGKIIDGGLSATRMQKGELADKLGVSAPAVSQWISGKTMPDAAKLIEIVRILDLVPALWPEYAPCANAPPAAPPGSSLEARVAAIEARLATPTTVQTENRALIELLERRLASLETALLERGAVNNISAVNNHIDSVAGHVVSAGTVNLHATETAKLRAQVARIEPERAHRLGEKF
jgi:transcriptional regulator with XRE-family HTH domain